MPSATRRARGRIAISAQIDPAIAGGVETNIISLLTTLARQGSELRPAVLALRPHREQLRRIAPGADVIAWRLGEEIVRRDPVEPARHGQALRARLGRHAWIFDAGVQLYRAARYGHRLRTRVPSAATIDRALARRGIAALHFPSPHFFATTLPFAYEPWDLQFVHFPEFFSAKELEWRRTVYRAGCERAAFVVTATQWTKDDIVRQYGIDPRKVLVIRRASLAVRSVDESRRAEIRARLRLPESFIFFPAMTFEHKNHRRLFEALAILRDETGLRIPLVLSGRRYEPFWPTLEREIERLRLAEQVHVLGAVDDETLAVLFSSARFMVFPSLFEGLGLPLLEAMRYGLPIIAARASCIPEVVGEAAVLVDPLDSREIAAAIRRGWTEPGWLAGHAARSAEQLERFDWEEAGRSFAACYRALLGADLSEEDRALLAAASGDPAWVQ